MHPYLGGRQEGSGGGVPRATAGGQGASGMETCASQVSLFGYSHSKAGVNRVPVPRARSSAGGVYNQAPRKCVGPSVGPSVVSI